jgi:hypothetical protein
MDNAPACTQLAVFSQVRAPVLIDANTLGGQLVLGAGFRDKPDPELLATSNGNVKNRSAHNDHWALRQVDRLRKKLNWDMSIHLGDLPYVQLNLLFSRFLGTTVKNNGEEYASATIMNKVGCLNRILRSANELRAIDGHGTALEAGFNIKKSFWFPKTMKTITTTVQKSAREGKNKKTHKVLTLTLAMEVAILADVDHQMSNSVGCQKRLAFYIMCHLGIRGGTELWNMLRTDLKLITSDSAKEYIV